MIGDPWLKLLLLLPFIGMAGIAVYWLIAPRPGSELRNIEELGSWDDVDFDVMADIQGRRRVSIYLVVGRDSPKTVWALMGAPKALRLARMLRIAAAPGKNLAQARYAFMKRKGISQEPRDPPAEQE